MATITSAGSGLWSNGAVWVGGVVPVDNDSVVIAAGHVVEFDSDTSSFDDIFELYVILKEAYDLMGGGAV